MLNEYSVIYIDIRVSPSTMPQSSLEITKIIMQVNFQMYSLKCSGTITYVTANEMSETLIHNIITLINEMCPLTKKKVYTQHIYIKMGKGSGAEV